MAQVAVRDGALVVELSAWERLAALRGNVRVPREQVAHVQVVDDAGREVQGLRAPGYDLPGHAKLGTWRRRGGRDVVVARAHRPGLVVTLTSGDRVVLSCDRPEELAAQLGR